MKGEIKFVVEGHDVAHVSVVLQHQCGHEIHLQVRSVDARQGACSSWSWVPAWQRLAFSKFVARSSLCQEIQESASRCHPAPVVACAHRHTCFQFLYPVSPRNPRAACHQLCFGTTKTTTTLSLPILPAASLPSSKGRPRLLLLLLLLQRSLQAPLEGLPFKGALKGALKGK